jgi:hypothetical protein
MNIQEQSAPKQESETQTSDSDGSWWDLGTCQRGHGRKIHGARISYRYVDGKKLANMVLPLCATDTRVSMTVARNPRPAGSQTIDCQSCLRITAGWGKPFTG